MVDVQGAGQGPDIDSYLHFALLGEDGWRKFEPFLHHEVSVGHVNFLNFGFLERVVLKCNIRIETRSKTF